MSLDEGQWASTLDGILSGLGYTGSSREDLVKTIGQGSVKTLVKKSFKTADTGTIAGSGEGSGEGLIGVVPGVVSGAIVTLATTGFGSSGIDLVDISLAIEQALIIELLNVTLESEHSPVFSGTGIIVPGSIPVTGSEWGANLEDAGKRNDLLGSDWPSFAQAIGEACALGLKSVTGQVTITGSGSDPKPGAGTGQGTLS